MAGKNETQQKELANLDAAIGRHSWLGVQQALLAFVAASNGVAPRIEVVQPIVPILPLEFSAKLARFVESILPALGDENACVKDLAGELLLSLRQPAVDLALIQSLLANFSRQVLFAAEEQLEIKDLLLKLLHLIIENISQLCVIER